MNMRPANIISLKWITFLMIATSLSCTNGSQSSSDLPNIIFIITDDQQCGLTGIEGNPVSKTPNIDRVAKEGAAFENFFVATPLCSPSRATFLTGQYAQKHQVTNNDRLGLDVISHTLMTWPRQLRENGYKTAFIGKWHMGLDDSRRPGFDRWLSFKGQGIFVNSVVNDEGTIKQIDGNMTDYLNKQAAEFLKKNSKNQPFAMILSHKAVHSPIIPAERHDAYYADYEYESPVVSEGNIESKPVLKRDVPWKPSYEYESIVPEPAEPRRGRGHDRTSIVTDQMRCLLSVDEGVGEIFKVLEEKGQLDNTIIVYTSDNGMLMGEHNRFHTKRWAYDNVLRVPFFMRYPKLIEAGSKIDKMVSNIDWAPTVYDIVGVEPLIPVDGKSFLPLFRSDDAEWRTSFFAEYFHEKVARNTPSWQAVRTENWKYVKYVGLDSDEMNELYDLANDPGEEFNLYKNPAYKQQLETMKIELQNKLSEISRN
jgi:N-acetylglucosamine-6-sulfatase